MMVQETKRSYVGLFLIKFDNCEPPSLIPDKNPDFAVPYQINKWPIPDFTRAALAFL